jgi:hypothetical protein
VSLPKIWPGLIFAVIPFILIMAVPGPQFAQEVSFRWSDATGFVPIAGKDLTPMHPMMPFAIASVVLGWAFWLYSVFRLHVELRRVAGDYPISPNKAALFHLIPLFNLYWAFAWTKSLSEFARGRSILMSRTGPAIALSLALLFVQICLVPPSAVFAHALALALTLIAGMYVFSNAGRALSAEPA